MRLASSNSRDPSGVVGAGVCQRVAPNPLHKHRSSARTVRGHKSGCASPPTARAGDCGVPLNGSVGGVTAVVERARSPSRALRGRVPGITGRGSRVVAGAREVTRHKQLVLLPSSSTGGVAKVLPMLVDVADMQRRVHSCSFTREHATNASATKKNHNPPHGCLLFHCRTRGSSGDPRCSTPRFRRQSHPLEMSIT